MMSSGYNLDDLYSQFAQMRKLGSLKDLVGMIPGAAGKVNEDELDDKIIDRQMAIITSMTKKERRVPSILNASRRKRIAAGAGVTVTDVNRLMTQYDQSAKMMKQFSNGRGGMKMPKGMGKMMSKMGKGGLGGIGGPGALKGMDMNALGSLGGLGGMSGSEDQDAVSGGLYGSADTVSGLSLPGRRDRKKEEGQEVI